MASTRSLTRNAPQLCNAPGGRLNASLFRERHATVAQWHHRISPRDPNASNPSPHPVEVTLGGKGDAHSHLGLEAKIFETRVTSEWSQEEKRPSDLRHPQWAIELNDDTRELVDSSDLVDECDPSRELVRPLLIE